MRWRLRHRQRDDGHIVEFDTRRVLLSFLKQDGGWYGVVGKVQLYKFINFVSRGCGWEYVGETNCGRWKGRVYANFYRNYQTVTCTIHLRRGSAVAKGHGRRDPSVRAVGPDIDRSENSMYEHRDAVPRVPKVHSSNPKFQRNY